MRPKTLLFGACLLLASGGAVWAAEDAAVVDPAGGGAVQVTADPGVAPRQPEPTAVAEAPGGGEAPAASAVPVPADTAPVAIEEPAPADVFAVGEAPAAATAPAALEAQATGGEAVVRWEDFDEPGFDPATAQAAPPAELANQSTFTAARGHHIALGPVGVDSGGRVGRIHTVTQGDTLWDISEAYLGTPWVWPSVWKDNREISNPHLIVPGDRIWITSAEMRRVSDAEAEELVAEAANVLPDEEPVPAEVEEEPVDDEMPAGELADQAIEPDSMDALPVVVPALPSAGGGRTIRVPMRPDMSFVTEAQIKAATSVVDSPSERMALALADVIFLGLGEGKVAVGDRFTLYRDFEKVFDPVTRKPIGYHVNVRGSAEVIEVQAETSVAVIRESLGAVVRGDRAVPHQYPPENVVVKPAPPGLDGRIAFLPHSRTLVGTTDYVYVNVGANDGVEVGTDLEVFERGRQVRDRTQPGRTVVQTPDTILADLVVVIVRENTSVAYVLHTRSELGVGNLVRGTTRDYVATYH